MSALHAEHDRIGAHGAVEPTALCLDDAPTIDDATHEAAVDRVIEMYRRCDAERESVPAVFRASGEWLDYISERGSFYDSIRRGDRSRVSDTLRNFWRNELGPIVKEYANFEQLRDRTEPRYSRFLERVPRNLEIWRDIVGEPIEALATPSVGNPWGMRTEGVLITPKATRFHALAHQLCELTRGVERAVVAEVGAGYGGMAYYLLRDRPDVRYVDFDLPETLVIAAYSLICSLPRTPLTLHGERAGTIAEVIETPGIALLPNHMVAELPDRAATVTLNTFSLSEMAPETLSATLDQIARITGVYFLHHNMDRRGVINRGFERTPASEFPVDTERLRLIHKGYDLFHGHGGDYREFLYERTEVVNRAC